MTHEEFMQALESECRTILKPHGVRLPKPWRGLKLVWHAWHEPFPVFFMSYQSFLKRVVEIEHVKNESEQPIRYRSMKLVATNMCQWVGYADWLKADADWQRADWQKARADWLKADADWQKAHADFTKNNLDAFVLAEAKECPGSTWDWHLREMTFKESKL